MSKEIFRNIVITGCNRGLGRALVKLLCEKNTQHKIVFTSRDPEKGHQTFYDLRSKYPKTHLFYHDLDVTNPHSIKTFASWFKQSFSTLDILVNNAGVGLDMWSKVLASEELMKNTLDTNFYGVMNMSETMLPILTSDGKIINISAMLSRLNNHGDKIKELLTKNDLTKEELLSIVEDYKQQVIKKNLKEWNNSAYIVSKTLVNAYTSILARTLLKNDQMTMAMCPGWCKTDLGGPKAPSPDEDGAKKMHYLMLEIPFKRDDKLNGKFFMNNKVVSP